MQAASGEGLLFILSQIMSPGMSFSYNICVVANIYSGTSCYTCSSSSPSSSSSTGAGSEDNCANFDLFNPPPIEECSAGNTCQVRDCSKERPN